MMDKVTNIEEIKKSVTAGKTIMIGGFLNVGAPEKLVDMLIEKDMKDLTIITNDTSFPGKGPAKLIERKMVKKLICTHIGTNPETGRQLNAGEIEVEFNPQGTFVERIRSAGAGLGGFLTPTGVGTLVAQGKQIISVGDRDYILELPLKADIALIKAWKADRMGNLVYRRSARNFTPLMAMAAELVIVEAENIVETGSLDPDEVMTPSILVDMIIPGGYENE
jgi:acetate CoA/acetoacetate CoA-transferase alpha subunit